MKYGTMTCYVYAEDEDDALELVRDPNNRYSEDWDDNDSGDTTYDFDDVDAEFGEVMSYRDLPEIIRNRIAPYRLEDEDDDDIINMDDHGARLIEDVPVQASNRFTASVPDNPRDGREALEDMAGDLDKL